ncbi:MAG: ParB/RepB/Spo0J family partition protein, partial [Chloroflexota bacterium]|nr:ParB/RepB/Spo0J family partition protein [Chloroflexota bacterium]
GSTSAAGQAPTPANTLPLIDLLVALEQHATHLPTPLPTDHPIPLPHGLPTRLEVPRELVKAGRYQPRTSFDETELEELAASIKEHGILNPLIVFASERGDLELIAGERRLRAAALAGLSFVPVEIRSSTLAQIAEIAGIDNLQRANLSRLEEGRYYNRLIDELQISENALATRLGKNRSHIQQCRAIASAASEVAIALDSGAITFSQARAIAQAAPGDPKSQKAAVLKIAAMTKQGRRVTEADARQAAETVVLANAKASLAALGWGVHEAYAYTLIWAPSEKPRQWTGVEIIEAIAQQRTPSATPPSAMADKTQIDILTFRHQVDKNHAPWIGLHKDWNQLPVFHAPSELAPLVAAIQRDIDAIVARYAAAGWTLTATAQFGDGHFEATGVNGGYRSMYGWKEAEQYVKQIETGTVEDAPALRAASYKQPARAMIACDQCKKKEEGLQTRHIQNRWLCDVCAAPVLAAQQARLATEELRIEQAIGDWLRSAPAGALPLIVGTLGGDTLDEDMDAGTVITHCARYILASIDEAGEDDDLAEDAPSVAALLGLLPRSTPHAGQAPEVAPALPADVVARASREPAPLRPESPAAQPADFLGDIDVTITRPLDPIRADVEAISDWTMIDGWSRDCTRAKLGDLADLRKRLDAFADAPDVVDDAFDDLSAEIGELELLISEWLPVEASV